MSNNGARNWWKPALCGVSMLVILAAPLFAYSKPIARFEVTPMTGWSSPITHDWYECSRTRLVMAPATFGVETNPVGEFSAGLTEARSWPP